MIIGGFKVGEHIVKNVGGKKHCVFDCKSCVYGASLSDDAHCRFHVMKVLETTEADILVLAEVYERVFNEEQTSLLSEVSALIQKFEIESIWSYSHLGIPGKECEEFFPKRHETIVRLTKDLISYDPISAYLGCIREIKLESSKMEGSNSEYVDCAKPYLATLLKIRQDMESTKLISKTKSSLMELRSIPETNQIYKTILEAEIKPSFISSRLLFGKSEELELLDEYSVKGTPVQIYSHPTKTENIYFINPPEYSLSPSNYFVLSKTKEVVASYKPGRTSLTTVGSSRKYFEKIYESTIKDVANFNKIQLSKEEIIDLARIVGRYTVGYGVLEILLNDRRLTDVYLDSPIGQKPLYVVHSDYGQCQTNVLYTEEEALAMVSKLRAMSGRPFDEAHPVLDYDLEDLETRVAAIGKPLAPDGTAFAFRLHKLTPWTLPQFIDVNYLNPLAAGLLSFFIDMQTTMLITGSRGSGKTSLLGAALQEIIQGNRIIVQEDTLELPVPYLQRIGYNIQRLKTKSPISISKADTEVDPAEALRTALRLGDSALVLGEVRSKEAKVLYEAMRVGAAGNIVIGTVHGDSAYSVWDRVVNDLEVPTTSFKATDLIVVARPIRFAGSLKKHRRITQITEVKKHWIEDPEREGGLLDIMSYNAKKDTLELMEDNLKESELFKKISTLSGLSMKQIWDDIRLRGNAKMFLVEQKNKYKIPILLEAEFTSQSNNKLLIIKEKQLEEVGNIDYDQVLVEWKEWVIENQIKKLLKEKQI